MDFWESPRGREQTFKIEKVPMGDERKKKKCEGNKKKQKYCWMSKRSRTHHRGRASMRGISLHEAINNFVRKYAIKVHSTHFWKQRISLIHFRSYIGSHGTKLSNATTAPNEFLEENPGSSG
uniref:Uncharacterized protein n=1 Tax=Parascaris univalens TaxID=6257 RepID=A0A915B367_PARUN